MTFEIIIVIITSLDIFEISILSIFIIESRSNLNPAEMYKRVTEILDQC